MILENLLKKETCRILGIMSGTSCDGFDIVIIESPQFHYDFDLIYSQYLPYPTLLKERIELLISNKSIGLEEFCILQRDISHFLADNILALVTTFQTDLIGLHGQTVYHLPPNSKQGYSLQMISGAILAARVSCPVVDNFRNHDLALSGQGAPLVPYFDYRIFSNKDENRVVLNIGGISNGTIIPAYAHENEIAAGDFGPGNTFIDLLMRQFFNKDFDENGHTASQGQVHYHLIDSWINNDNYFHRDFPKSCGRERFDRHYLDQLINSAIGLSELDLIATVTALTAAVIDHYLRRHSKHDYKLFISGGGAKNNFLRNEFLNKNYQLIHVDNQIIDFKEAIIFAFLAKHFIEEKYSTLPNTSGVSRKTICGSLSLF